MSTHARWALQRREILSRTKRVIAGHRCVVRKLECGHEQVEPKGSKAKLARAAFCGVCWPTPGAWEAFRDRAEIRGRIKGSRR